METGICGLTGSVKEGGVISFFTDEIPRQEVSFKINSIRELENGDKKLSGLALYGTDMERPAKLVLDRDHDDIADPWKSGTDEVGLLTLLP